MRGSLSPITDRYQQMLSHKMMQFYKRLVSVCKWAFLFRVVHRSVNKFQCFCSMIGKFDNAKWFSEATCQISHPFLSNVALLRRKCSRTYHFSPFLAGVLCLLHRLSDPLRIRRGNIISCEATWRKTKQLHKQRRESFQAMIEGNRCQIDSDFNNFYRTESGFAAPGPDDVIEGLILILSGSHPTHTSPKAPAWTAQ